jgi:hypothetical protein
MEGSLVLDLLKVLASHGIVLQDAEGLGGVMEEAAGNLKVLGKQHGFKLNRVLSGGGEPYYEVRFKDGEKWLNTRKKIYAQNEKEAVDFAVKNKHRIISEYKNKKTARAEKKGGISFYETLSNYYVKNSKYLERDTRDNKIPIPDKIINHHRNRVEKIIIPFLKGKEVKSFKGVTREV